MISLWLEEPSTIDQLTLLVWNLHDQSMAQGSMTIDQLTFPRFAFLTQWLEHRYITTLGLHKLFWGHASHEVAPSTASDRALLAYT